ncbi:MAG: hypothetical protein L0312_24545, partial [Acidobacteria bacterium]|nr:hypothetical protein [Acidobacteriota bacterium]
MNNRSLLLALWCGLQFAAGSTTESANAQSRQYTLENKDVRLVIDEKAKVVHLSRRSAPSAVNLISQPLPGFWTLIFRRGQSLENVVESDEQNYQFEQTSSGLNITVNKLRRRGEELNIAVHFRIELNENETVWKARIENRSDVEITEFDFPEIGGFTSLGNKQRSDDLIWPNGAGFRYKDLKSLFRPQVDGLERIEEPVNRVVNQTLELTYPGRASMSWYEWTNGQEGIYFGSHDPSFIASILRVTRRFDRAGELSFGFSKFPFIQPGEIWESGAVIVSPHTGNWRVGAAKYRQWVSTWRRVREKPDWVQKMKGMFLVILKQQYGDVMWKYDEIPALYQEARENGMDTVALFGWTEGGHD